MQERIRHIIKEYPKLVLRIKRHVSRWEEAEEETFMRNGVQVMDSVTNGDPHDSLLRAMHVKLMGVSRGDGGGERHAAGASPSREFSSRLSL